MDLPTLTDGGYDGAGIGVFTPVKQPADGQTLDVDTRAYNHHHEALAAIVSASGEIVGFDDVADLAWVGGDVA